MFGENAIGEFQDSPTPKKIKINFNQAQVDDMYRDNKSRQFIVDVKLGGHHSLILTSTGLVYSCGYS
jgi:alpha-tubulin suppressor-like RCC1 family protein